MNSYSPVRIDFFLTLIQDHSGPGKQWPSSQTQERQWFSIPENSWNWNDVPNASMRESSKRKKVTYRKHTCLLYTVNIHTYSGYFACMAVYLPFNISLREHLLLARLCFTLGDQAMNKIAPHKHWTKLLPL